MCVRFFGDAYHLPPGASDFATIHSPGVFQPGSDQDDPPWHWREPPACQVHGVSAPLHEPGPAAARDAAGAAAGDAAHAAASGAASGEPAAAWH